MSALAAAGPKHGALSRHFAGPGWGRPQVQLFNRIYEQCRAASSAAEAEGGGGGSPSAPGNFYRISALPSPLSCPSRSSPPKLSLAPMMEYTDRHFRFLCRLLSERMEVWTEMITSQALVFTEADEAAQER